MLIQVNKVRSKASDISRPPLGGGGSTDRTSQVNLRKLNFTNTLYQLAYSQSQVVLQYLNIIKLRNNIVGYLLVLLLMLILIISISTK